MTHVVVAGAGPVGLTAALALLRTGIAVTVLEAGPGLAAESRASTFHPPTLEMLRELGVLDPVLERGLIAPVFAYRDRVEGLIAALDLAVLAGDTPFPFRVQLEQSKLTPILLAEVERLGGAVRFGSPVTSVEQAGTGATATTADGHRVGGDWVIGADGAHSAVRRSLGVDFEGITYPERFLVASTEEELPELLDGLAAVNYVFDPVDWSVLLRTPDHWRVLLPTPDDSTDDVELARLDERLRLIADPGRPWRVAHASIYRVHQRVAASFRTGRVLLAGDAAHVNNPLGGLGMNSGIHDSVAYAAAIADSADAVAAAAADRRRIALEYVQSVSHQNYVRLTATDPRVRADHLAELRATAADPVRARAYLLKSSMISSLRPVPA
ncbi:3-(3-hydroxy-phenyl)propionate hydroxylase [Allocatelliglobosispora scoriae]|uniref:3-(3-hydroxy-phenyl)propionate hydroxylase n=1 Tax=Allocatelliglobosispora scoriae TaxID=643052 RepID=A0A841C2T1_9ACTN|nr:NAD(P)/FAD-dependent oxidoreductase [Allocatelliglobosispora scoriae]MBB5873352.1 3-(3-hydroxy-phenyl)propionate hydroxylase [Allocatelliglobosispora scoriae]